MSDTYPHIIYVKNQEQQDLYVPAATQPPIPPQPAAEASVTIAFAAGQEQFIASRGTELDSYTDPAGQFTQRCIVCNSTTTPGFRAIYRPDAGSIREEWIFEYGDPWVTPPTAHLPPYTVTITKRDGTTGCVTNTVGHYWFSRWRWYSAPRAVRRTHQQLAAQNLIPYFDTTGLVSGPTQTVSDYTPMAYCGIPAEQGQTGGYAGLGIQTGWQTQYLVRGAPESSFRNQGEASGSFQAHIRDTRTQAPIDIVHEYPNGSTYSAKEGNPYIPMGPRANRTDAGHMPSVSYLPFLLTGDPYYLEEMQFWSNQNMLMQPPKSRFMVAGRYLAWPSRAIFECYIGTPESAPSWLLPRSYWKYWLDVCKGYITTRMANNSDPYFYVFHTIPDTGPSNDKDPYGSGDHVWQQNMLELVASWIATTQDDWVEPAEWLIHNGLARVSATSGWCRSRPSPYHIRLQNASVLREAMTTTSSVIKLLYAQNFMPGMRVKIDNEWFTLTASSNLGMDWSFQVRTAPANHNAKAGVFGDKNLSWRESADLNILTYGWTDTGDNNHLAPSTTDLTYPSYQRAALAQALHAGLQVPGLFDGYNWIDAEMRRLVSAKRFPVGDNWCVMPNLVTRRVRHASDDSDPLQHASLMDLINETRGDEIEET